MNDKKLNDLACNSPASLAEYIQSDNIKSLTKAMAIVALGERVYPSYFNFLKNYISDKEDIVRELAFRALSFYYTECNNGQYDYLLAEFRERLQTEKAPGVRRRLESLIKFMQKYEDLDNFNKFSTS
jgi:HEAT repeat protein